MMIMTLTGTEVPLDVEGTDKILRIKERVEEETGIPPPQQRIIYQGKTCPDEKTISDCKLTPGSTVHLVLSLRGGF